MEELSFLLNVLAARHESRVQCCELVPKLPGLAGSTGSASGTIADVAPREAFQSHPDTLTWRALSRTSSLPTPVQDCSAGWDRG